MTKDLQRLKYKTDDIGLDINYSPEDNTFWLSNKDICILYGKSHSTITRYIKLELERIESAVFEECPTCPKNGPTISKSGQVQLEGNRKIARTINYYCLDIVLAIGDKIGSDKGLLLKQFLDDYLKQEVVDNKQDIIIYNNGNVKLDVKISPEEDTVWLNVNQISELFDKDRTVIIKHIDNIYEEGELIPVSTCAKNAQVQIEGDRKVTRVVEYYNLDMILAVGYRTSGKRAIEFRRWASSVLKRYLLKGYAIDNTRVTVTTENFVQLENDISDLKNRMDVVEKQVFEEPPKEKLFFNGQYYDAYEFISSIIRTAKESIIVIDPYCDNKLLTFLKSKNTDVDITVIGSSKSKLSEEEIDIFIKQFGGNFILKYNDLFHDRFMIIDSVDCYSLGTSINYMGNKIFSIYKYEDKDITKLIIKRFL